MNEAGSVWELIVITAVLLLSLTMLISAIAGSVVLIGWGGRSMLKDPTSAFEPASRNPIAWVRRLGWSAAFLLLPGPSHLAFSFIRDTPRRFRLLAAGVSIFLVFGLGLAYAGTTFAHSAGIAS